MFRPAVRDAMKYTLPIVTSLRNIRGLCGSGIGTCVVINDEGWIITAAHVIKGMSELAIAESNTRAKEQAAANASRADRRAKKLGPSPDDIDKWSVWYGGLQGVGLDNSSIAIIEPCDLAVGRLLNFDGSKIAKYPVFKDPNKDYEPGANLCRLGFPFFDVGTSFDAGSGGFRLANSPLPIFLNEGLLSRMHELQLTDPSGSPWPPPPFPLRMIETSSPGIKGQSGGPIFDQQGAIWAIQSSTTSYPMDFSTKVEQYYHVGVGISSFTILGLLQHLKIKFEISTH